MGMEKLEMMRLAQAQSGALWTTQKVMPPTCASVISSLGNRHLGGHPTGEFAVCQVNLVSAFY